MSRPRSVPLPTIRDECRLLERTIVALGIATAASLDPYRPGGPENADSGPHGWLRFYGQLHRVHGRKEEAPVASSEAALLAAAEGLGLKSLSNAPETVRLSRLPGDEGPRTLSVYPKGLGALILCHELDERAGWLALRADELKTRSTPEDLDLLRRVDEEMLKVTACIIWIITHPTPGIPWTPGTVPPEPPVELQQIDPADLLVLHHAHLVVNGIRIELVRRAFLGRRTLDAAPAEARLQWTTFVGATAIELKVRPHELYWDWGLGELLTAAAGSGEAHRQARASAEAASAAKGG